MIKLNYSLCLFCGVLLLSNLSLGQPSIGPIDFESDTVGNEPSISIPNRVDDKGSTQVEVVNASSTPANPIGADGNKSVLLQDTDPSLDARLNYVSSSPLTVGTVEFTFCLDDADNETGNPWGAVYIGSEVAAGHNITFDDLGPNIYFSGNLSGGTFVLQTSEDEITNTLDGTFKLGTIYKVVMNFDSVARKWSGTINGSAITKGSGAVTSFAFHGGGTDFNAIEFVSGFGTITNTNLFVDDITVAPKRAPR